jgi:UDP-2,4-diacetamido-2,4,6-trideoxy-beta-L-altropyranose hydrolase
VTNRGECKLLIRADGCKSMGMGHLSRASLVASVFRGRGYDVKLVVKEDNDARRFLDSRQISPVYIAADTTLSVEFDLIEDLFTETRGVLILDSLCHRDYANLFGRLRAKLCTTAVIFDDDDVECINADIALNGSLIPLPNNYAKCVCQYLIGPDYFIMDPSYRDVVVSPPKDTIHNILVTVGGSDHKDLLFKLLEIFDRYKTKYKIKIVSSSSTGYSQRLSAVLKNVKFPYELHLDLPSLVNLWGAVDVAITAGGNTLFERIATCLPGATLCQMRLQMKHADAFERIGVNTNLGYGPDMERETLFAKVDNFLNNHAEHERQYRLSSDLIDGDALVRFVLALEKFHFR